MLAIRPRVRDPGRPVTDPMFPAGRVIIVLKGINGPVVIEPIDPFHGGLFNGPKGAPWAAPVNDCGFEQAIDRFCHGCLTGDL